MLEQCVPILSLFYIGICLPCSLNIMQAERVVSTSIHKYKIQFFFLYTNFLKFVIFSENKEVSTQSTSLRFAYAFGFLKAYKTINQIWLVNAFSKSLQLIFSEISYLFSAKYQLFGLKIRCFKMYFFSYFFRKLLNGL